MKEKRGDEELSSKIIGLVCCETSGGYQHEVEIEGRGKSKVGPSAQSGFTQSSMTIARPHRPL